MNWEYKTIEVLDYGHPGGEPRFQELAEQLAKLSDEGWEVVEIVPSMMRGRANKPPGESQETSSLTVVAILAVLRRQRS